MSTPFSSTTPTETFAPRKKEPMNVREQMLEHVHLTGWMVDPSVTIRRNGERKQDPHAFARPAKDGGTWHVRLDYNVVDGWGKTDNLLRNVELTYTDSDGAADPRRVYRMANESQRSGDPSRMWSVTGRDLVNALWKALRARTERVLSDPDLVAWLIAEDQYHAKQKLEEQRARWKAEREARDRPVQHITVDRDDWRRRVYALKRQAEEMYTANGLSDARELLADLEKKVAAIRAAVDTTTDPA